MTWAALLLGSLLPLAGEAPHFETEILPLFTRVGCNAGACHGAAAGRGGFHLSLFASDAAADFEAIVWELEGRRVNRARPEQSLLYLKPTGQLKHGGKKVLGEREGETLLAWIAAGVPRGSPRRLTSFRAFATPEIITSASRETRLRALARFDNGPEIDVTTSALFTSPDPSGATVEAGATIRAVIHRRGQHDLTVRFLDRVEPLRVTFPLGDKAVNLASEPLSNLVDAEVIQTLKELRLPVSPQASEAEYLRRLRLDLTGRLPTPEEQKLFQQDTSPEKSKHLVNRLLQDPEFAEYWTLRFSRMLQLRSLPNEKEGVAAYTKWLRVGLEKNMPMNQWGKALLNATGDSHEYGPANFHRMANDPRAEAELVSKIFLGARLQCANCHNHPLDRWTQDDYHGLAAVFARMERGRLVAVGARGAVTNPRTSEQAVERIPGVRNLNGPSGQLGEFSTWAVSSDNPAFPRAMVNRIWQWMFGRGLVEPVDDMRTTNPATHPELLNKLAEDFVRHGYDLRHTVRQIALSRAYGRSAAAVPGNEADNRYYSRFTSRPLEPEVLADAIADVTGVGHRFANLPERTRAITLYDPLTPAPSLDILGRCNRVGACQEPAAAQGLAAKLHLLNGDLLNERLASPASRIAKGIEEGRGDGDLITEVFQRALARKPSLEELQGWVKKSPGEKSPQRKEFFEDFLWALLNSREFNTNH